MTPHFLFYVEDPVASSQAIEALLDKPPVERSPGFALFVLDGLRLGLWRADAVRPAPEVRGENGEISLAVETRDEVDSHHALWRDRGLSVLQPPEQMDFGYTATVALPGPLRLRVFQAADTA